MAQQGRLLMVATVLSGLLASGCLPEALVPFVPQATTAPVAKPTPSEGLIINPDFSKLHIAGTVYGLSDMTSSATIKGDNQNVTPEIIPGLGFRVMAAHNGKRKLVENAAITLKGYDWKIIPLMPTKITDAEGKFKFRNVPSRVAFFLDGTYAVGGATYRSFGLVRTGDGSEEAVVEMDTASTLVARLLLRLMHYTAQREVDPTVPGDFPINKTINFGDLSPKDYNPLLNNLRDILRGGLPIGMSLDMSRITQPDGEWTLAKDQADPAVVLLDQLAGYPQIDFDIQRLCDAIAKPYNIKKLRPPSAAN